MTDRLIQVAGSFLIAPVITVISTGSAAVIEGVNSQEIVLNTVNLAITAASSIIIQLGIAYIQAKFKNREK